MGMGMLFAGALTGGANAVGQLADDAIKQRERDHEQQSTIMARRSELLFEMKAKADMARQGELEDAQKYDGAVGRAEKVGDDRRFAKFRDDLRATGGGEGMSEEQLREVFNSQYNNKQSTTEAGGTRYMEPESRNKADVLDELRKGGASGGLLKTARDDLTNTQRAEQQARSEALKEKQLEQRDRQFAERLDQQAMLADERNRVTLEAADRRASRGGDGGGSEPKIRSTKTNADGEVIAVMSDGSTRPLGIQDQAYAKNLANMVQKMREDSKYRKMGEDELMAIARQRLSGASSKPASSASSEPLGASSDVDALRREISRVEGGKDSQAVKSERLAILRDELKKAEGQAKAAGQKSTVKDNQTTGTPSKVSSKAEYDALPKGTRYVAPDGTVRTKG